MIVLFFAVCGPKFTKFGTHVGEWLQFSTPFSDRRYLVPVRRYSRSKREIRNFDVFGPPNFLGEGPHKFFTHIKKLQSPPNIWQSLVTIGPETSEIRRRKKSMIETSAVKYNGRRPASWQAAITNYTSYLKLTSSSRKNRQREVDSMRNLSWKRRLVTSN